MSPAVWSFFTGALVATTALSGQVPAGPAGQNGAPKRLFVDSIVASVNDSAILQSKLFQASEGDINGAERQLGRAPTFNEVRQIMVQTLRKRIGNYQMAQSARSFGNIPPDRFDMILESMLERDKQDRVRELGSWGALGDELERQGQTWPTYVEGVRIEHLQNLAESFAIYERLRKQSNLYLTPRMLRETYEQFRDRFVSDARAEVALVSFTGPDAKERAEEASDYWANHTMTARELADRYPGASALLSTPARSLPPKLRDFGLAGPEGNVSHPIPHDKVPDTFYIARIMRYLPARNGRFSDPEVQAQVRQIATEKVIAEFRMQAIKRAQQRTEVWIYQNGRAVQLPTR